MSQLAALEHYLDQQLGGREHVTVTPMPGGGSCEIFALDRGDDRWVLRRAPRHASSSTAHDVLREFRILDAIKDEHVRIARPVLCCDDPDVFGAPFYVMERIDGAPVRKVSLSAWAPAPRRTEGTRRADRRTGRDPRGRLEALRPGRFRAYGAVSVAPGRRVGSRSSIPTVAATCPRRVASGNGSTRTASRRPTGHALPRRLQARQRAVRARRTAAAAGRRRLGDGRDRRSAGRPRVGADLPPRSRGTMPLGMAEEPRSPSSTCPTGCAGRALRRALRPRRRRSGWYDVFSRWKLAIVLEGSYAKFLRGLSDKPIHEFFGSQADLLLAERRRPHRTRRCLT